MKEELKGFPFDHRLEVIDPRIPNQFVRTGAEYQEEIDAFCEVIRQEARKKNTAYKEVLKLVVNSFREGRHRSAFVMAIGNLSIDKELLEMTYFLLFPGNK